MAKKIFKYLIDVTDKQSIEIPKNSQVISIQEQKDVLRLWAIVDPEEQEQTELTILIIGTGRPLPEDIDTYQHFTTIEMCGGNLVWHIFIRYE